MGAGTPRHARLGQSLPRANAVQAHVNDPAPKCFAEGVASIGQTLQALDAIRLGTTWTIAIAGSAAADGSLLRLYIPGPLQIFIHISQGMNLRFVCNTDEGPDIVATVPHSGRGQFVVVARYDGQKLDLWSPTDHATANDPLHHAISGDVIAQIIADDFSGDIFTLRAWTTPLPDDVIALILGQLDLILNPP